MAIAHVLFTLMSLDRYVSGWKAEALMSSGLRDSPGSAPLSVEFSV